jgi:hypothetical protein
MEKRALRNCIAARRGRKDRAVPLFDARHSVQRGHDSPLAIRAAKIFLYEFDGIVSR